jgi:hypothetical protein
VSDIARCKRQYINGTQYMTNTVFLRPVVTGPPTHQLVNLLGHATTCIIHVDQPFTLAAHSLHDRRRRHMELLAWRVGGEDVLALDVHKGVLYKREGDGQHPRIRLWIREKYKKSAGAPILASIGERPTYLRKIGITLLVVILVHAIRLELEVSQGFPISCRSNAPRF